MAGDCVDCWRAKSYYFHNRLCYCKYAWDVVKIHVFESVSPNALTFMIVLNTVFFLYFLSVGSESGRQRPHCPSLRLLAGVRLRGQRFNRRLRQLAQLQQLRRPGLRLPQRLGASLQEAGRSLRWWRRWLRVEQRGGGLCMAVWGGRGAQKRW